MTELTIARGGPLLQIGFAGVDAIGRRASQCLVNDWVLAELPQRVREKLYRRPLPEPESLPLSGGLETVRELVVGAILESVREQFDPFDPPEKAPDDDLIGKLVRRGVDRGMDAVVEVEPRNMAQCSKTLALLEKAGQRYPVGAGVTMTSTFWNSLMVE